MTTAIIVIVVVVGFLIGGLLALKNSGKTGLPPPDVLKRASKRARELDAEEQQDKRDD